jgi:hypothetical protein
MIHDNKESFKRAVESWYEGDKIEYRPYDSKEWFSMDAPFYCPTWFYRVAPTPKHNVRYGVVYEDQSHGHFSFMQEPYDNLKLTFTDGILTNAEVIK